MKTNGNEPIQAVGVHDVQLGIGLTKREYFAAIAMQGLLSNGYVRFIQTANDSVKYADALIEALNQE